MTCIRCFSPIGSATHKSGIMLFINECFAGIACLDGILKSYAKFINSDHLKSSTKGLTPQSSAPWAMRFAVGLSGLLFNVVK